MALSGKEGASAHRGARIASDSRGPVCSKGQFSVGPEHVIISTPDPDTAEGAPVEGSAVVPVMCANCGYTMLFSPRKLPQQGE
jgi:hypothetical protein